MLLDWIYHLSLVRFFFPTEEFVKCVYVYIFNTETIFQPVHLPQIPKNVVSRNKLIFQELLKIKGRSIIRQKCSGMENGVSRC